MAKWRNLGNVTLAQWTDVLRGAGSPLLAVAQSAYDAADPHTALGLAMLRVESQFGTAFNANIEANKNYLNLRPPTSVGFMSFSTAVQGIREWRDRITSPTYKNGIYKNTTTVEELIHVYAPSSDGNNEAEYVRSILNDIGNWRPTPNSDQQQLTGAIAFGNVPRPPILELICTKLGEGHGFNTVPPRQNIGICEHITAGRGSVEFYHKFFSIGGEREHDALVDFVVGRDGRIAMLNDWRGTRAPHANGNTHGLEGNGTAFLRAFNSAGVNQRLVSIEHEGHAHEDWTTEQWNAAVGLDAWLCDQMGIAHDSFPVHQDFGLVTHLLHSEFTDKGGNALDECPGRFLKRNLEGFRADVRALMKQHQLKPGGPTFAIPASIPWKKGDTGTFDLNGTPALAFLFEVKSVVDKLTPQVSATNKKAVGPKVEKGQSLIAIGSYRGGPNRDPFVVLDSGGRIPHGSVAPALPLP